MPFMTADKLCIFLKEDNFCPVIHEDLKASIWKCPIPITQTEERFKVHVPQGKLIVQWSLDIPTSVKLRQKEYKYRSQQYVPSPGPLLPNLMVLPKLPNFPDKDSRFQERRES